MKLITCPACGGPLVERFRMLEFTRNRGYGWKSPIDPGFKIQAFSWCPSCKRAVRMMKISTFKKNVFTSRDMAEAAGRLSVGRRRRTKR